MIYKCLDCHEEFYKIETRHRGHTVIVMELDD